MTGFCCCDIYAWEITEYYNVKLILIIGNPLPLLIYGYQGPIFPTGHGRYQGEKYPAPGLAIPPGSIPRCTGHLLPPPARLLPRLSTGRDRDGRSSRRDTGIH